jgi:UDP-N-acetylmuramate--alanine ligase
MTTVNENIFKGRNNIHFIGVGGSGMFPLVQILLSQGFSISGSDNNPGDTTDKEIAMGVKVYEGHSPENLKGADLVVYSAAIMQDNPELAAARKMGIPVLERAQLLGLITRRYPECLCVAGTHGKTTTTSMLTMILLLAGKDPSAVIGGKLEAIGGSGRAGSGSTMVCEACEFVDTFLHLDPSIAVILNVDEDHLDYFGNLQNIIRSFHRFALLSRKYVVVNGDDQNALQAVEGLEVPCVRFGWSQTNRFYPENISQGPDGGWYFDIMKDGCHYTHAQLNIPGRHNILNALAACAAADLAEVRPEDIARGLSAFQGVGRRFEILGSINGVTIADDYAHHPAELKVTLEAAAQMGFGQVWAVFQPFTYSRTSLLLEEFAQALSTADHVVMSAIMGGRENNTYNISTADLALRIPGSVWFETFPEIAGHVLSHAKPGDLVITLGCGDIYKCAKLMLKKGS